MEIKIRIRLPIYADTLADIDGKQYYFNQSGFLVLDTRFTYDEREYSSGKDGIVTLIGSAEKSEEKYGQEVLKMKESAAEETATQGNGDDEVVPSWWRRVLGGGGGCRHPSSQGAALDV